MKSRILLIRLRLSPMTMFSTKRTRIAVLQLLEGAPQELLELKVVVSPLLERKPKPQRRAKHLFHHPNRLYLPHLPRLGPGRRLQQLICDPILKKMSLEPIPSLVLPVEHLLLRHLPQQLIRLAVSLHVNQCHRILLLKRLQQAVKDVNCLYLSHKRAASHPKALSPRVGMTRLSVPTFLVFNSASFIRSSYP